MHSGYFLKCDHCGHLNPLKTEYITFCEKCHKKMINNFPDWNRNHPTKTFSDFIVEIGVFENSIASLQPTKKIATKKRIFVLFILATTGTLGVFLINADFSSLLMPAKTPKKLLNADWSRYVYSKSGWSMESPERFSETPLELSEQEAALVTEAVAINFQPSKNLKIEGVSVLYREKVFPNLPLILRNTLQNLIHQQGVTNLEFKESPAALQNLRGVLLEGTYHKQGEFMRFQMLVYSNRFRHWHLVISVDDDDPVGKAVAEKIINSLEIEENLKSI